MNHPYNSMLKNSITVIGKGIVEEEPDLAYVSIGVVTEGKELTKTQHENNIITDRVIAVIKSMGVADKDIQTSYFNIEPIYDYSSDEKLLKGYRVTNMLTVTVRDIDSLGKIIDASVSKGANQVNNIRFDVADRRKLYDKALRKAIRDAKQKAESMSYEMNVMLNPTPVKVTEEGADSGAPTPYMSMEYAKATPIEVGTISVSAAIKAVFLYIN